MMQSKCLYYRKISMWLALATFGMREYSYKRYSWPYHYFARAYVGSSSDIGQWWPRMNSLMQHQIIIRDATYQTKEQEQSLGEIGDVQTKKLARDKEAITKPKIQNPIKLL